MNETKIDSQLAQAHTNLFEAIDKLTAHMKEKHGGFLATTCHRCMSLKLIITDNRRFMEEIKYSSKNIF